MERYGPYRLVREQAVTFPSRSASPVVAKLEICLDIHMP